MGGAAPPPRLRELPGRSPSNPSGSAHTSRRTPRSIPFVAQARISLQYRDCEIEAFFADFIVDEKIVLEIKSVERHTPLHRAQVYSYLGATNLHLSMLINFNVPVLYRGVSRVVR